MNAQKNLYFFQIGLMGVECGEDRMKYRICTPSFYSEASFLQRYQGFPNGNGMKCLRYFSVTLKAREREEESCFNATHVFTILNQVNKSQMPFICSSFLYKRKKKKRKEKHHHISQLVLHFTNFILYRAHVPSCPDSCSLSTVRIGFSRILLYNPYV